MRLGLNSREYKSVSIEPVRVLWVEAHELVEHNMSDGSQAHGGSGMPTIGFEGSIDLKKCYIVRIVAPDEALKAQVVEFNGKAIDKASREKSKL